MHCLIKCKCFDSCFNAFKQNQIAFNLVFDAEPCTDALQSCLTHSTESYFRQSNVNAGFEADNEAAIDSSHQSANRVSLQVQIPDFNALHNGTAFPTMSAVIESSHEAATLSASN